MERTELSREDVTDELWAQYTQTDDFQTRQRIHSISSVHPLVKKAEEAGLKQVISNFIGELEKSDDIRVTFINRSIPDWLDEWRNMHETLFQHSLKNRGYFRKLGQNVRIGSPGDEDLYRIPLGGHVFPEIIKVAEIIKNRLEFIDRNNIDAVCGFLALVHYEFIRVHPFLDGNGRIARVIVDQLSISLGYIPVVAGFPRTNTKKKSIYHKAIRACIYDNRKEELTNWIKKQMEDKLREIA